jgi:hypothetical protein
VDVSCEVVAGLVVTWLEEPGERADGEREMSERERDAFEQHLLFCPPCLARGRNARIALDALRGVRGGGLPGEALRRALTALVQEGKPVP